MTLWSKIYRQHNNGHHLHVHFIQSCSGWHWHCLVQFASMHIGGGEWWKNKDAREEDAWKADRSAVRIKPPWIFMGQLKRPALSHLPPCQSAPVCVHQHVHLCTLHSAQCTARRVNSHQPESSKNFLQCKVSQKEWAEQIHVWSALMRFSAVCAKHSWEFNQQQQEFKTSPQAKRHQPSLLWQF